MVVSCFLCCVSGAWCAWKYVVCKVGSRVGRVRGCE
jgi:hypothetical protein